MGTCYNSHVTYLGIKLKKNSQAYAPDPDRGRGSTLGGDLALSLLLDRLTRIFDPSIPVRMYTLPTFSYPPVSRRWLPAFEDAFMRSGRFEGDDNEDDRYECSGDHEDHESS